MGNGIFRLGFFLTVVAVGVLGFCLLITRAQHSATSPPPIITAAKAQDPSAWKRWVPPFVAASLLHFYCEVYEGLTPVAVHYDPAKGRWIDLEIGMDRAASGNGVKVIRFEAAGTLHAYVCVKSKDARAMRKVLRSLGTGPYPVASE